MDDSEPTGRADGTGTDVAGRHRAFTQHVLPEIDVLLRVALTLTHQPADAEDLVQDTLIRAFRACDRFDGAHPRAWLLTILRNTQLNRVRGRRPSLLDDPDTHHQDQTGWPGTPAPSTPEDLIVGDVFDDAVATALDDLPETFGAVIRLVDLNGLSYAEAAGALGIPVGTVMSRLHRGRARIRESLTHAGLAPPIPRSHARAANNTPTSDPTERAPVTHAPARGRRGPT